MSTKIEINNMFLQIDRTLMVVQTGISLYNENDLQKKDAGLRNVIVFGRAVTNALQKLRGIVDKEYFNLWYAEWQNKMKNDSGMLQLYKMRSQILKEGILDTNQGISIDYLGPDNLADAWKLAPPGSEDFFIGDQTGGSGFHVKTPDGKAEVYYINLPETIVVNQILEIKELPPYTTNDGRVIENTSQLLEYYYHFLAIMINDAKLKLLLQ